MTYIFFFLISMIMPFILLMLSKAITKWEEKDNDKFSPFECGFDPMMKMENSLTIRFYLLSIIFLIFDVEIALILPMIINKDPSNMTNWILTISIFIIILILGLLYEWFEGSLDWS